MAASEKFPGSFGWALSSPLPLWSCLCASYTPLKGGLSDIFRGG